MNRGAIAEISLSALALNFHTVKKIVKNRPVIAVVKADAYGHGAIEVSKRLLQEGADSLAVAYLGEAIQLREAGIQAPVIMLFDNPHLDEYIHHRLTPVLYSFDRAYKLSEEAKKRDALIKIHVKVDTGMGRHGLNGDHAIHDLLAISELPGLEIKGLLSHFSEADLADRSFAVEQLAKFTTIKQALEGKLGRRIISHIANSAAVLTLEEAHLDAVRPGIMLYGYSPLITNNPGIPSSDSVSKNGTEHIGLIPAMKIKTRILCVRNVPTGRPISYGRTYITKRPSRIGVLPVGYADGYNRLFSNNAYVLVKGKRAPQAVTLLNTGTAPLAVVAVTALGDFGVTSACPPPPATLAPSGSCEIAVTFAPGPAGARTGTLTVMIDSTDSPHLVGLAGEGVAAPVVGVSPASLDFGGVRVGTTSGSLPVTVTNTGGGTLTVGSGLANPVAFAVSSDGCSAGLASGQSCVLGVTFAPTATGSTSGALAIQTSAGPAQAAYCAKAALRCPPKRQHPHELLMGFLIPGLQFNLPPGIGLGLLKFAALLKQICQTMQHAQHPP